MGGGGNRSGLVVITVVSKQLGTVAAAGMGPRFGLTSTTGTLYLSLSVFFW